MRVCSLLWLTAIFFIEIAVIRCRGSTSTGLTNMYSISRQGILSSKSYKRPPFTGFLWRNKPEVNSSSPITTSNNNSASTTTKGKHSSSSSSSSQFDPQISEILSPDIFSQADPFLYLLNKMMINSGVIAESLASTLNYDLKTKKFPPEYIPYAKALLALLRNQRDLCKLQQSVCEVKSSIDFDNPFVIISTSPRLQMLFSTDIFSDTNPPARILNKMLDLSEDEVIDIKVALAAHLWHDEVPQQYIPYAQTMVSVMRNADFMGFLRRARSELNRFSNIEVLAATQTE